jgi:Domain of unknown function (DUF397)
VTTTGEDEPQRTDGNLVPIYNGMPATELIHGGWIKSKFSNPSGNCVELAELSDGSGVAVRNSRDPDGPVLIYTKPEIYAFVRGVIAGDFDLFLP